LSPSKEEVQHEEDQDYGTAPNKGKVSRDLKSVTKDFLLLNPEITIATMGEAASLIEDGDSLRQKRRSAEGKDKLRICW
jgi:hypothetical protein